MKIENGFHESASADTATQTRRRRLVVATAAFAAGASMVALAGCSSSKSPDALQETVAPLPPFATPVAPLASPSATPPEALPTDALSSAVTTPNYLESMSSTSRPATPPESTPSFTSCFWTDANKQLIGEANGLLSGPVPGASLTRGCDERDRPANIPANGFYTFERPTLSARADIFDDPATSDNPLSRKVGFCTVSNSWIKIVVDHGAPVPSTTPEFVPVAEFGVLEFPPQIPPVPCK